jgi:hypothetical protein
MINTKQLSICMVMQKKAWMIANFFSKILAFFYKSVLDGISQIHCHLLILDGHGSHVTLKTTQQTQEFGLDMVTSPSHTLLVF